MYLCIINRVNIMIGENFNHKLLDKIRGAHIKPRPKWQFLLKDYVVWGFGVAALLIGGAALAVIIYLVRFDDWSVYSQIGDSFFEFALLTLPYFWLVLFALFVAAVNYNIKHTKRGYKYSLPSVVSVSLVLTLFSGLLFSWAGLGRAIDNTLGERAPFYTQIFNRGFYYWSNPAEGRLVGIPVVAAAENEFIFIDNNNKEWTVTAADLPGNFEFKPGPPLRLLGEQTGENTFRADKVLPLGPGRGFLRRPHSMPSGMHRRMMDNPEFRNRMKNIPDLLERFPELQRGVEGAGRMLPRP